MRSKHIKSVLLVLLAVSWILGIIVGRWHGTNEILLELSRAVSIPKPQFMNVWWEIIAYFTLTTVSVFVLSHIFFGIGGSIFLFARGMHDSFLLASLESSVGNLSVTGLSSSEILISTILILIFSVNLPLCLWAGQLGAQRSIYTLNRLRNNPIDPELGSEPFFDLARIVTVSLAIGLIVAIMLSY